MKVVVKSGHDTCWYSLYIGLEFIVTDEFEEDYAVYKGKNSRGLILKSDCEIVNEIT